MLGKYYRAIFGQLRNFWTEGVVQILSKSHIFWYDQESNDTFPLAWILYNGNMMYKGGIPLRQHLGNMQHAALMHATRIIST